MAENADPVIFTQEIDKGLQYARAYVQNAIDEADSLANSIEEVRVNLEEYFPTSEQVANLQEVEESVRRVTDELACLDWPSGIAAEEHPTAVTVTAIPIVSRGKRKGQPKRLTPAQERRIQADAVADWVQFAIQSLADYEAGPILSDEQKEELSGIYQALSDIDCEMGV